MRPLTVITGIVLGSCGSIAASMAAVLIMFLVLHNEYPRLNAEFAPMLKSLGIFSAMTAVAALSFYSLLINHRWHVSLQLLLWLCLAGTGLYYWPS